jgi:general secretion pathway protein J
VMLIRVANAPGTTQHLEFVKIAETVDERGFALVRSHAPFKPLDPNRPIEAQLYFADPVVLIRAPFRVSFAFAGPDRLWRTSWQEPVLLPAAARIEVRDAPTDKVLAISTATLLHMNVPVECITQKSVQQCIEGTGEDAPTQGSASPSAQPAKSTLIGGGTP